MRPSKRKLIIQLKRQIWDFLGTELYQGTICSASTFRDPLAFGERHHIKISSASTPSTRPLLEYRDSDVDKVEVRVNQEHHTDKQNHEGQRDSPYPLVRGSGSGGEAVLTADQTCQQKHSTIKCYLCCTLAIVSV